ncbi:MAG TPA: AraC family ligand binding domain-containing protein, partial [Acetobacteraceae bacterium]|nr:AraC family ligand binding domain-containing protein [Acetobacteraceae bacterium]
MNQIDSTTFWRHPRFPDLCLLKARFTQHRYELHTHPTYVVALITEGCEQLRIGSRRVSAPRGTVLIVHPEQCHDGEAGVADGWSYRTL